MTAMKLHFDSELDFQRDAVEAVCELFNGQESCRTEFTVTLTPSGDQQTLELGDATGGVGNRLKLSDEDVLKNLQRIQTENGLRPAEALGSGDFSVEMETGTGKTYVYLRTIYELNKRFGHTKFVIVVPSIAIKEGVYKTFEMTKDHFKTLYSGTPLNYFLYDSSKLDAVRNFATSSAIQVMIVTVGAINKKATGVIYKDSEKTGGYAPIDLIRDASPILIVDEPQSVDGGLGGKGKEALEAMNPLCTLRYSATHVEKHNMVYRLDAVDAYERKLVKQIEVASATIEGGGNTPFVRLVSTSNKGGTISAKVEIDVKKASGVKRSAKTVNQNDDLEQETGRELYKNIRVGEIRAGSGKANQSLELHVPGGNVVLKPGQAWGDVDAEIVHRLMIHRTIKEHFDKELRLRDQGIKVLSLFFLDHVASYRGCDEDGNQVPGPYAAIFEEQFVKLAGNERYVELFEGEDVEKAARDAHDGYFSIDKRGKWSDTSESTEGGREAAERAYNLIMKEKEKLLSFETPLRFIFSHSALREGWDNPNVFQICSLREMGTDRQRRQTIGRGLRLCVNQDGERVQGFEVNTLTVVATEDYASFAEGLQKEIEEETGVRFGVIEPHQFIRVATSDADGNVAPLGLERSEALWKHLKQAGYIDAKGQVQEELRSALDNGDVDLPAELAPHADQIVAILKKYASGLQIKNADERRTIKTREKVLNSPEFKALWDQVKDKTTYRVDFDNEQLIADCIKDLRDAPETPKTILQIRKAGISIGDGGVTATELAGAETLSITDANIPIPDVLTDLQDRTGLTRRSILKILQGSDKFDELKRNPQAFIQLTGEVINFRKQLALVDGIKYQRVGDDHYYAQELFEQEELTGYIEKTLAGTEKSVYAAVVWDSEVERTFATELEKNSAVKVYAKLPGWFKIPTPLGSYNPDWAVLIEQDGDQRLYFVVETKSNLLELRDKERAKIKCGEAHFAALKDAGGEAKFKKATILAEVLA